MTIPINLILLDSKKIDISWRLGQVCHKPGRIEDLCSLFHKLEKFEPNSFLLFWGNKAEIPSTQLLGSLTAQPVDIWHAGLLMGTAGLPKLIDFVSPTWMLNRDPEPIIEATSWRVSLQACLVRSEMIRQLGFLDASFQSLAGAALEWGHRCIQHGALMRHFPGLLPAGFQATDQEIIPFIDQYRFVHNRFGRKWASWATLRALLSGYVSINKVIPAWNQFTVKNTSHKAPIYQATGIPKSQSANHCESTQSVSVLIPTLERYPYLHTLLNQLSQQSHPADEILVVDQTPPDLRQPDLYQEFIHLPLRVFYQEQPGQCSSRNLGLQAAKGDYILFLDDDDEIPHDLIEKHLRHLENSGADASCGAADEVGAGPLPAAFTYRRASDVFPTNNTLLRKSALVKSGLFDLAYEHGARADGDLGMRLYLSGAKLIYEPKIRVLHHHAPRGGLRVHKARKITYASSRKSLLQRHLPGVTELYLVLRFFSPLHIREHAWISILGTFSLHDPGARRWVKFLVSSIQLPHSLWVLARRTHLARKMLEEYPKIPGLETQVKL